MSDRFGAVPSSNPSVARSDRRSLPMRRVAPLLALVATVVLAIPATAAPKSKLQTFGTGVVTIESRDAATLDNDPGEYSGVYIKAKNGARKIVSVKFSFDYTGDIAGGAPRFSIPIDTDHNRTVEGYAFLDAINCGDDGRVSTTDADCKVFFQSEVFDNWAAFAQAHPKYRIPPRAIPFIIADQEGTYHITDIDLR
jgi:hypothetical protein